MAFQETCSDVLWGPARVSDITSSSLLSTDSGFWGCRSLLRRTKMRGPKLWHQRRRDFGYKPWCPFTKVDNAIPKTLERHQCTRNHNKSIGRIAAAWRPQELQCYIRQPCQVKREEIPSWLVESSGWHGICSDSYKTIWRLLRLMHEWQVKGVGERHVLKSNT